MAKQAENKEKVVVKPTAEQIKIESEKIVSSEAHAKLDALKASISMPADTVKKGDKDAQMDGLNTKAGQLDLTKGFSMKESAGFPAFVKAQLIAKNFSESEQAIFMEHFLDSLRESVVAKCPEILIADDQDIRLDMSYKNGGVLVSVKSDAPNMKKYDAAKKKLGEAALEKAKASLAPGASPEAVAEKAKVDAAGDQARFKADHPEMYQALAVFCGDQKGLDEAFAGKGNMLIGLILGLSGYGGLSSMLSGLRDSEMFGSWIKTIEGMAVEMTNGAFDMRPMEELKDQAAFDKLISGVTSVKKRMHAVGALTLSCGVKIAQITVVENVTLRKIDGSELKLEKGKSVKKIDLAKNQKIPAGALFRDIELIRGPAEAAVAEKKVEQPAPTVVEEKKVEESAAEKVAAPESTKPAEPAQAALAPIPEGYTPKE